MSSDASDLNGCHQRLVHAARTCFAQAGTAPGILSFTVPVPGLDPVDWVAAQSLYPKVYWQGREGDCQYAGVGAALLLRENDNGELWAQLDAAINANPGITLFGGMRFDTDSTPSEGWAEFGRSMFILPEFVIESGKTDVVLRCNVVVETSDDLELVEARLIERLKRLVFEPAGLDDAPFEHVVNRRESDRAAWQDKVRDVIDEITAGTVEKVVLARRMDVTFAGSVNPFRFIRDFRAMPSPAYFFCFQLGPDRAFAGSSPERLYARRGLQVLSEALASTRPRGASPEEDAALEASLLTAAKDRHEHALVHDCITAALGRLCDGPLDVSDPVVMKLVLVQHLLQEIKGVLNASVSDRDLVEALHPTPAVGGVPTEDALRLLGRFEDFDRGWDAAPVGIVRQDHVELAVAIRSGLLHDNTLSLYCGAGIVRDSDPEQEWAETENKLANFLHVIHAE